MLNDIDLVTVTCARDFGIQKLQSYSINLMLTSPCRHYVIVEDSAIDLETWRTMLSPYYAHHQLHVISGKSLLPPDCYVNDSRNKNGWHRSAVLKLLAAEKVQSKKYLILDSKNFFVYRQSLNDWPVKDGNGIIEKYNHRSWTEVDVFCVKNNIPIPKEVYNSSTPFMADTAIVKEIIKFDILSLFFNKKEWWSSEIFLYSIFSQNAGKKLKSYPVPNVTFWNSERVPDKKTLTDIHTWPNMRAFGLHRHVLKLGTDLTDLVNFLVEIEFDKKTVKDLLKRYAQDVNP
jgi:Family of unknown function (DUF6492)